MVKHFRMLVPFLLVQQIGKTVIARQDAPCPSFFSVFLK